MAPIDGSSAAANDEADTLTRSRRSVLAWSAWRRVLMVLPVCAALWLGVAWALAENLG